MSVLYIVLPLAFVLAASGVGAFLWAVRKGQYDDLDTPPIRALFDDEDDRP
jgi:cbb3-type cytochrome oxidase maturation protein